MTRIEKAAATLLATVALAFAILTIPPLKALAQTAGGAIEGAAINVLDASTGLKAWRLRSSSNALVIESYNSMTVDNANGVRGLIVDNASGGLVIPQYTTAQLATINPGRAGVMVVDTTLSVGNSHTFGTLKVSTGTGLGAWTVY